MKKMFCILAIFCGVMFTVSAQWQTQTADGGLVITGYTGNKMVVTIPDMINGAAVVAIGNSAFSGQPLTSVTIPNSVISIGDAAFYMTRLTSVMIPASVTSIGKAAFFGTPLTSANIPAGASVGDFAFPYGIPGVPYNETSGGNSAPVETAPAIETAPTAPIAPPPEPAPVPPPSLPSSALTNFSVLSLSAGGRIFYNGMFTTVKQKKANQDYSYTTGNNGFGIGGFFDATYIEIGMDIILGSITYSDDNSVVNTTHLVFPCWANTLSQLES
jgi:hypothetical protein